MPLGEDTSRFPGTLDRAAILARLVGIRGYARQAGQHQLAAKLEGIETMEAAQVGVAVIAALSSLGGDASQGALAKALQIVAMNLKNLK